MNILYVSSLCSDKKFNEIFEKSIIKPQQQAQKFHSLLSKGLITNVDHIYVMSRPPINKSTKLKIKSKEAEKKIVYHYLKVSKNPLIRHFSFFFNGFINTLKWIIKNKEKEKVIFCDVLNLSISIPALLAAKLVGIKIIAIVTDLPNYIIYSNLKKTFLSRITNKLFEEIYNHFISKYDSYILLTEQMNPVVNPYNKPYVIIEGIVNIGMENIQNTLNNKYKEKIIMYTGALHEKYGVKKLIEAFIDIKRIDSRLWIYGAGDMEDEVRKYERKDTRIKYFGVVPNEEIVKEQLKATLLVNPRSYKEEYTKYSFPSKNMEYMASGTPVLAAPLKGMPKEYFDYVFLINDDTKDGLTQCLDSLLGKSSLELHEKGQRAKEFVLAEKNNIVQANKAVNLVNEVI
ncbi:Glycosyltransferase involved in cell wall bisynthesis [Psychrobacillus psychrotolerans]|uniref:Glycosyltransferase involved in cell wall bisynthesis n=1 Tax=Psychrobacillus psychrotolerans TaxID=126156 RepID=A0A1I6A1P9_9BACI|nr:glycosyltransferase [Psychrobacillus psychrotolerans]SFQ62578.1 Glycosyltransferase involved in cell wall bisynthesis [Psychrobacillus psychrotolerans]